MPTPAEQKALVFLGAVALLGGAVRLFGGEELPQPTSDERLALDAQLDAIGRAAESRQRTRGAGARRTASRPSSGDRRSPSAGRRPPTADRGEASDSRPPTLVDLDRATAEQLESLPGIGPALAARIVADRQSRGGFGSFDALDEVSGVGPALIKRLAPHVTFSAPRRPSTADGSGGGARASGRVVGLIGGVP